MVDMTPEAITDRLKVMSQMQEREKVIAKGVDMSPAAITGRLKMQSALTDLCLKLGQLRPQSRSL